MTTSIDTLSSYVPAMVARRLATNPAPLLSPEIENFPAAVFFADISGFGALAESLSQQGPAGAEELTRVLNNYFGRLIDLIDNNGGDIIKFAGDAVLAFWPVGHDTFANLSDATLCAAQCGLAVQAMLHNPSVGDKIALAMRIGISAGPVTVAHVGGVHEHWELLVSGKPVVQASLAEQRARPGEVLLTEEAWALVQARCSGFVPPTDVLSQLRVVRLVSVNRGLRVRPAPHVSLQLAGDALRSYLPGDMADRLALAQQAWLAELRRVTVLFINLPDLQGEIQLDQAQAAMRALQTAIYRYQGSINKLSIDEKGVMVLAAFGLPPQSHEDDALRGVQTALAAQSALQGLGLRSALGVTTGRVFCGIVGNDLRHEYTIIGDVVNVAARLMQAALEYVKEPQRVAILCDAITQQQTQGHVEFEPLAPLSVKGKAEPLKIFRPLNPKSPSMRVSTAMIGRLEQRHVLTHSLQRLKQEDVSTGILIEGEAGIGKSRLVDELHQEAEKMQVQIFTGRGSAIEQATPYHAWHGVFSQLFDLSVLSDLSARRRHILDLLEDEPELLRYAPLFNAVLPLDLSDNEFTRALTGSARADRTRDLLLQTLQLAVARSPKLLILEDAHWFDSASWTLAWLVSQRVRPLMLVMVMRPILDGDHSAMPAEYLQFRGAPQLQQMRLDSLSAADIKTLVCQRLGISAMPAGVLALINEKAQGNPFFSLELAFALRDTGVLIIANGICQVSDKAGDLRVLHLPDTVQGVITSRIDRLLPQQQLTLKVASVIGREFELRLLKDIHPVVEDRTQLKVILDDLRQLELIAEADSGSSATHRFKHVITHETVYNLMLFAQRRELHRAVGEWYERVYAGDLSQFYGLLAHHWSEAGDHTKTLLYLELAGDQAVRLSAFQEALTFYTQAFDLATAAGLDVLEAQGRQATLTLRLGEVSWQLGQLAVARARFEESLKLSRQLGDQQRIVTALNMLGRFVSSMGEYMQAMHLHEESLSRASQIGYRLGKAHALNDMGQVLRVRGEVIGAQQYFEESLQLYNELNHLSGIANALINMAWVSRAQGLLEQAKTYANRSLERFREISNQIGLAQSLDCLGMIALANAQYELAMQRFDESMTICNEAGYRLGAAFSVSNLGDVALRRGEYVSAGASFADSLEIKRELGDLNGCIWDLVGLARVATELGNLRDAQRYLREAMQIAQRLDLPPRLLNTITGMAYLRAQQGRPSEAAILLGLALNHPACDLDITQNAWHLLELLRLELSATVCDELLQQGKTLDLNATIAELLQSL